MAGEMVAAIGAAEHVEDASDAAALGAEEDLLWPTREIPRQPPRRYTLSKKTMEALNTRGQTSSKLESLPAELLTEVLKMLTWKDVLQLRAVSCSGSK